MGGEVDPKRKYDQEPVASCEDWGEDVYLDVPELHVDSLEIEVEDLKARVALQADVLSLLRLHVGIDAALGRVRLDLQGVDAQALLKVRLDKVAKILEDVLATINANPQIVEELARGARAALTETLLARDRCSRRPVLASEKRWREPPKVWSVASDRLLRELDGPPSRRGRQSVKPPDGSGEPGPQNPVAVAQPGAAWKRRRSGANGAPRPAPGAPRR